MNDDSPTDSELEPKTDGATDCDDTAMLSEIEARIIGGLMEKQLSTPDAYPLTANSLLSACNQKSNREPVTSYQHGEVVRTLRQLESRKLVRYEMGARSERYEQRFTNELSLSKKQHALMCVMLLRGPQTINELQSRTQRLHEFENREDLEVSLERLTQGENPYAVLIPRHAGQREDRYGHLLCGVPEMPAPGVSSTTNSNTGRQQSGEDIELLRAEVIQLRHELDLLYKLTGNSKTETAETATQITD